ncbi:GAF and ANTAR domain-containing protein [Nocardia sp. NPDC060256]|uniref:GAF and ANTAR domain-containing protein n=1 Tax=unclassified Nocardia TaxID=2637762 RepID=UPI003650C4BE
MPESAGSSDRSADRVRAALAAALHAADDGLDALVRVCRVGLTCLPVDGMSISLVVEGTQGETLYVSDEVISRIETLQFSLGEGPCFEAFDTRRPVLVADLATSTTPAWPVLATEIAAEPIGAIFAFPLLRGAISLGAMDLYRRHPGTLSAIEISIALYIADIATHALLGLRLDAIDARWWTELPSNRAQVNQAIGMLISALGLSAEQVLARLRGYAFVAGRLVDDVADDLVHRRLDPRELGQP